VLACAGNAFGLWCGGCSFIFAASRRVILGVETNIARGASERSHDGCNSSLVLHTKVGMMWMTYMLTNVVEGARRERGASGDDLAEDRRKCALCAIDTMM
jgi:hypothetical protein